MASKFDFYDYAYNAIRNSMAVLTAAEVEEYYSDPEECTIEDYFTAQTDGTHIYDHTEEFSEATVIGSIEELRGDFEQAREAAYNQFSNEY